MNQSQWTAFKDIMAGSIGGMFGTFLGQPADVIKTRMQTMNFTNPIYTSNIHCVKEIMRKEGISGFFKGITPPLLSSIPINAIIFPVQHISLNFVTGSSRKPTGSENALAGGIAGFVQAPIASVNELLKIQLQSNRNYNVQGETSIMHRIKYLIRTQGITNGLFRGLSLTIIRDIPGFSIYFYTYDLCVLQISTFREFLKDFETIDIDHVDDNQIRAPSSTNVVIDETTALFGPTVVRGVDEHGYKQVYDSMTSFVGGGIAGVLSWLFTLPIDCLKTIVQAPAEQNEKNKIPNKFTEPRRPVIEIAKAGYKSNGMSFFFRGVKPTLVRAFFVNAGVFVGYELIIEKMKLFDKYFNDGVEDIEY